MSLSIIIPSSGNPRIIFVLESLIIQEQIEQCEIILVTNKPSELAQFIGPYQNFVTIASFDEELNGHPASKLRNRGVQLAKHKRILFLDNDVILGPGALKRHLSHPGSVLCGHIRELAADSQILLKTFYDREFSNLWKVSIRDYREPLFGDSIDPVNVSWKNLYSGHFSIPAEDFMKARGFDETGYRCHDLEFGLRLEKLGINIMLDPNSQSIHLEHPRSLLTKIEQINGWNLIARNHPEYALELKRNAATSRYRIQDKLNRSLQTFEQLTSNFKGIQCGTSFVVTPGTSSNLIRESLSVPYEYRSHNDTEVFSLRLARDCWDFSIVVPSAGVLSMPYFSIIIPTYNAANYIERAIDSVFAQSFQSFEIVIIDDNSSDNYHSRISKYLQDGRVRVLYHRKNLGLSKSLNAGLNCARGRYIVHLDSDDWFGSGCLQTLYHEFSQSPELAAIYGSPYVHDENDTWREMGWNVDDPTGHFTYPVIQAPRAYKRQTLLQIGGWSVNDAFEGRYYEDRLMLARMHDAGRVKYSDNATYNVRVLSNSLGRSDKKNLAVSKYIILNSQAANRGKLCNSKFNGDFLVAELSDIPKDIELPKISVIIPHHNRWEYLDYCIYSWLESDLPGNGEIIVVDDGSSETGNFNYDRIDPRVKLIKLPRKGAATARNEGVRQSSGELIIFCDCDHIVPRDICKKLTIAHQNGTDVCIAAVFGRKAFTVISADLPLRCLQQLIDQSETGNKLRSVAAQMLQQTPSKLFEAYHGNVYQKALGHHFIEKWQKDWADIILIHGKNLETYPHRWMKTGTALLSMTKAIFNSQHGFDERFISMEDWEFGIRLLKAGAKIEVCPDAEPLHQVHPLDEGRVFADARAANLLEKKHPDIISNLRNCAKINLPPGAEIILGSIGQDIEFSDLETLPEAVSQHETLRSVKFAALTFDDGPHMTGTPIILKTLEKLGVRATFFVLASQIPSCVSLCKSILTAGHEIGLHGWDHTPLDQFEPDELRDSFIKSLETFSTQLNYKPKFFRPPYGRLTLEVKAICDSLDIEIIGWDINVDDWSGANATQLIRQFTSQFLKRRADPIILLHDGSGDPINSSEFITWLAESMQQVEFLTLSEYVKTGNDLPQLEVRESILDFENIYLDNISLSDFILKNKIV